MIRAEVGAFGSGKRRKARWRGPLIALAGTGVAIAIVALMRSSPRAAREPGLSVLLITIDTLRADAVGAYGRASAETPWIDRLAAAGVRFDRAHAHSVLTLPSHASILSGLLPLTHGIRDNDGFRFPAGRETLATLLKQRGYATGAFVSAFPLDSRFGLDRAFDVYDDRFSNADTRAAFAMEERRGVDTVAAARDWIASRGPGPFFCWVHLYDPHFPYDPPEPHASRFRSDPYQGEVAAADTALGPLLDPILPAGSAGRVLVVLTADHGESLGDHGEKTHGIFAYESTLRVPLILFAPRLAKPRVVHENRRHIDILPTVLDALGIPAPAGLPGHSLLDAGPSPGEVSYFESLSPARSRGWAPLYGLLKDGWKYVDLPIPELYDLAADPSEGQNLAAARPEIVARLQRELTGLRATDPGSRGAREDAEVRERLRSLGYLAGGANDPPRRHTEEDDPKRLIAIDALLQSAAEHYGSGDLDGALRLCAEAVERRPDNAEALAQLGSLHRLAGRLDEAIPLLRKAVALQPDHEQNVALLATTLGEAGRPALALRVLEPYARRPEADIDVLMALGIADAQLGRASEALTAFERVRKVDPSNAMALVNIATVHLGAGDPARARQALEAALALNPRVARAHNALGVLAAESGHASEAVEHWKSALELEPRDLDTLYNLGHLLWREGQRALARPYLERFIREASPSLHAKDIAQVRGWLASR
jgi:arylsulfatase A-like enzyme/Flp pilus assembly protein TadD